MINAFLPVKNGEKQLPAMFYCTVLVDASLFCAWREERSGAARRFNKVLLNLLV